MGAESAMKTSATILLLVPLLAQISFPASVFDKPELRITASPDEVRAITLPGGVRVVDYDVSPGSSFPQLSQDGNGGATDALSTCAVNLTGPEFVGEVVLRGRAAGLNGDLQYAIEGSRTGMRTWRSAAMPLVSVQVGKLAGPQGPGYVFTLERRRS